MRRTLMVLFAGSALLATFCMAIMQYFGFVYDYYFSYLVPGVILFGVGCAMGLFSWRGRHVQSKEAIVTGMQWLAVSALAGVCCLSAQIYLPFGTIYLFLLQVSIISLPYLAWTYGAQMLTNAEEFNSSWVMAAVAAGTATGLFASQLIQDYAGGAIRTGWVVCSVLSIVVLGGVRRQSFAFVVICMAMVIGMTASQITTTKYSLPQWEPGSPYLIKPILDTLSEGKNLSSHPLQWTGTSRTDLLSSPIKGSGYDWVITNATAPVPIFPGDKSLPWLQSRFPLVAIPLMSGKIESMMSVSPRMGPEISIAKQLKIPNIQTYTYSSSSFSGNSPGGLQGIEQISSHGVSGFFQRINHPPRLINNHYDLVILPITHPVKSGWAGSNTEEVFLYTREAIRSYWSSLNDGGVFAVTTMDEMQFVRMTLTLWDMLSQQRTINHNDQKQQTWGIRLVRLAPYKGSYQFLLMAIKGAAKNNQSQMIKDLIDRLPVEVLFGPGFIADRPYNLLERPETAKTATDRFTRMFSQRIQRHVDLRTATDQRPYFFHVIREAHPYMKWLLTVCLAIVIPVLLFPLANKRRPGTQGDPVLPPLPVILGYFGFLGSVMVMVAMAVAQQASQWSLTLIVSMISGLAISEIVYRKLSVTVSDWAPVLLVLFLAVNYWLAGLPGELNMEKFPTYRFSVLVVSCLAFGVSAGTSLQSGIRQIKAAALYDLLPWVWIVTGVMALASTVLVYWFSMLWGWNYLWGVASAAGLLVLGAGLWMKMWLIQPLKMQMT